MEAKGRGRGRCSEGVWWRGEIQRKERGRKERERERERERETGGEQGMREEHGAGR